MTTSNEVITRRLRVGSVSLGVVMIVAGLATRDITIGSGGFLLVAIGPTLTYQSPRRPD